MALNIHQRSLPVTSARLGEILETLAGPDDEIWHSDLVESMILSDGLNVGSQGGHGPVRYRVVEHVPGRLVRFEFKPTLLRGHHAMEVVDEPGGERATLRHTIDAELSLAGRVVWPLVRRIHDGALEDMLDHVERSTAGIAHRQQPTARWVRRFAAMGHRRVVKEGPTDFGPLQRNSLGRIDAVDCWVTPLAPLDTTDPVDWAAAVLGRPVPGVRALMRLRDALVRPFGLRTVPSDQPKTGFPLLAASPDEALLGLDDKHLSFRVGIRVVEHQARVITSVQIHNRLGRAYWAIVRFFHPRVVRKMVATTPDPLLGDARSRLSPHRPG